MSCQLKGTLFIVTGTILWGASGVLSQHLFVDKIISCRMACYCSSNFIWYYFIMY